MGKLSPIVVVTLAIILQSKRTFSKYDHFILWMVILLIERTRIPNQHNG